MGYRRAADRVPSYEGMLWGTDVQQTGYPVMKVCCGYRGTADRVPSYEGMLWVQRYSRQGTQL